MTTISADTSPAADPAAGRAGRQLLVLCAVQFMLVLDVSVANVALPSTGTDLQLGQADLQWIVTAYVLTFGGLLILAGRAGDAYGYRRVFTAGVVVFTAASLLCGLAETGEVLITGRALQGIGAAMASPAALALVGVVYPDAARRARAFGVWAAVASGGAVAGVLAGGLLTDLWSWRAVFLVNVPLGVIAAVAARILPPRRGSDARRLDLTGGVLLTAALAAAVFTLSRWQLDGVDSTPVRFALVAAVLLVLAFAIVQYVTTEPLIPARVLRNRPLVGGNLMSALVVAAATGFLFFCTLYLQQVLGLSPAATGLTFLPTTLIIAVISLAVPRLLTRFGARTLGVTGAVWLGCGLLLLSQAGVDGTVARDVLPGLLCVAVGNGLIFTTTVITATTSAAPDDRGLASGLLNTSQQIGGALGLAVLVGIATARTDHALTAGALPEIALVDGFRTAYLAAAGLAVAAAATALILPRRPPPTPTDKDQP